MTSAQVEAASQPRRHEASLTAALAAAGLTLLTLRLFVLASPSAGTLLAATYLILWVVFVAVPVHSIGQPALRD